MTMTDKVKEILLVKLKKELEGANAWQKMLLDEAIYAIEDGSDEDLDDDIKNGDLYHWVEKVAERVIDGINEETNILSNAIEEAVEEAKESNV